MYLLPQLFGGMIQDLTDGADVDPQHATFFDHLFALLDNGKGWDSSLPDCKITQTGRAVPPSRAGLAVVCCGNRIVAGSGRAHADDVLTALIMFCGGAPDDKCMAAFFCTDVNDDGFIDRAEMMTYMQIIFQVCMAVDAAVERVSVGCGQG